MDKKFNKVCLIISKLSPMMIITTATIIIIIIEVRMLVVTELGIMTLNRMLHFT
jgi:hypothetical protein